MLKINVDRSVRLCYSIINMNNQWTLKIGKVTNECSSFPFAFRAAFNAVRSAVENKQNPSLVTKDITILGPKDSRGDRNKYSYYSAMELARGQGLLSADNQINSKEFKKR